MPDATRPRPEPRPALRDLLALPFRAHTWRHLLYALLLPLVAGLVLVLQFAMRAASDSGHPWVGPLLLLAALVAAAVAGPAFERMRLRLFFGERVAPRDHGRFTGGAAFFFLNMLLTTLSCAATVGWVVVCARNLTYPIWGWKPYPDDAWGGPTPIGAVALHFFSGVLAFFLLPWLVLRITGWQRAAVHRFVAGQV